MSTPKRLEIQYVENFRPTAHRASRPYRGGAGYTLQTPTKQVGLDHNFYNRLLRERFPPSPGALPRVLLASGSDSNDMTIGGMELALVGLCVSVLAIHLGLLLFHGARRRDAQGSPPAAAHHARLSEPCLWREVFPAQPDHELVLAYQQPEAYVDDQAAFVQQVRKRSGSVAGAIKHELSEVQRQKSALASSTAAYPAKILGTEEAGRSRAGRTASGSSVETWKRSAAENGAKRPTELGDEEALKRVRFGGVIDEPDAKKRSSWLIKLDEGTELKP